MKIKRGDNVKVIAGDDKGATGVVIKVLPKEGRVIVQGVNIVKKHRKPSQSNPDGSIEEREAPIHISNVALIDPKTKKSKKAVKTVRVGFDFENGKKIRVCHKTGAKLD